MRRLIVGCGYLGLRVARRWRESGDTVLATTRGGRRDVLAAEGFTPVLFDALSSTGTLPDADTVVVAMARERGQTDAWPLYHDGFARVLAALPPSTGRLIHVSSTGVYDEEQGGWVDELSPATPVRPSPRALLAAEGLLWSHPLGTRGTVLRLGGLYGDERQPLARDLAARRTIRGHAEAWMNFVHVDDAARAVLVAAEAPDSPGATINVTDGTPVTRGAYAAALAARLGTPPPTFDGEGGLGKRVRIDRLRTLLALEPVHPSALE